MTTAEVVPAPSPAAPAPAEPAPVRLPRWLAVAAAVAAGVVLLVAFPNFGQWWCAPIGVALLALAVHRRGFWAGAGLGALTGLTLFVMLLSWTRIVGGTAPWLILSALQAAFVALLAGLAAWSSPLVDRYRWSWPLLTAALWTGQEALRDRIPFGGFPWGRLAFSQGDSPLLRYAALGGAPLVTFLVALTGGLVALLAWQTPRAPRRAAVLLGAAVLVVLSGLVVPSSSPGGRAVTVAIVQGNVPRLGLEFNAQRRAVLDNHVDATLDLAARIRQGTVAQPDLVVWPENASDIDPLIEQDADARARISQAADTIGVPILLGAVLVGPGDHARNAALVWLPGDIVTDRYVKRHPVPFAEYMPLRSIARLVSDRVDLVRSEFVPGDRPGVLQVGPARVGVAICFEVAYDDIVRDTVDGGAALLAVQTNNADFTAAEAGQQLAMVRLRAVEHGRDALMVSTVGISGFATADGRVFDATGFNVRAVRVRELRLGTNRTLASELGPAAESMLVGLGLLGLAGAGLLRRRQRLTADAND
ncbi:MAG TPA: apolipoprotein N-acyltransferase [Micromonosporaceae bacterium]